MSRIVNLTRARKDKARRDARARADANAAAFGLSKAQRGLAAARRAAETARHEAHRVDRGEDDAPA